MDTIEVGQVVNLMGISRDGKSRIKQFGALWRVERIFDTFCIRSTPPPYAFLRAVEGNSTQWISIDKDANFKITGIQLEMF